MTDTPSARIAEAAQATETVTDAGGRKLTLRTLGVLDQARLLRAIGPQQASNQPYTNLVMQAAMVSAIDGRPLPFPVNERMIDHILTEVGDDGFAILTSRFLKQLSDVQARADAIMLEGGDENPLALSGSSPRTPA